MLRLRPPLQLSGSSARASNMVLCSSSCPCRAPQGGARHALPPSPSHARGGCSAPASACSLRNQVKLQPSVDEGTNPSAFVAVAHAHYGLGLWIFAAWGRSYQLGRSLNNTYTMGSAERKVERSGRAHASCPPPAALRFIIICACPGLQPCALRQLCGCKG